MMREGGDKMNELEAIEAVLACGIQSVCASYAGCATCPFVAVGACRFTDWHLFLLAAVRDALAEEADA